MSLTNKPHFFDGFFEQLSTGFLFATIVMLHYFPKFYSRYKQNENDVTTLFQTSIEYRKVVISKLVEFTNNIVASLLENVYSFPKPISWIVYQISKIIEKSFSLKQVQLSICLIIVKLM